MYNDGSISHRLREMQRETDAAYARVHFINRLLGEAQERIKNLESKLTECESARIENEKASNDSGKSQKTKTQKVQS